MRALVVEDEPLLNESLTDHLVEDGFTVDSVEYLSEAQYKLLGEPYDVILLDLRLPDGDGMNLLKEMRDKEIDSAVIILTARGELEDRVEGLNLGADDYLSKPFSMQELSARLHAVLRRKFKVSNNHLDVGPLRVDLDQTRVMVYKQMLSLTQTEYNLLRYLALNKDRTVTRIALAEHVWGDRIDDRFSLDFINSHIKNLRKKLNNASGYDFIKTIYGMGYQLQDPETHNDSGDFI